MDKLRYLKILFLFAGLIITSCSGTREVISQFNNGDIKVDGNTGEWKQLTRIKNENIAFGFSNDSTRLYITMITNDKNKISSILHGGLEVRIDPGVADNKITVRYPEKPDPGEMMEQMKRERYSDKSNMDILIPNEGPDSRELDPGIAQFLSTQKLIYIVNEYGRVLGSYPLNSNSYQVNLKVDRNSLCYELAIPFGSSPLLNYNINNAASGKLGIRIISGEVKSPAEKIVRPEGANAEDKGMSGPPSGGEGNPPSGGRGGGPGGPNGGPGGNRPGEGKAVVPIDYSFDVTIAR